MDIVFNNKKVLLQDAYDYALTLTITGVCLSGINLSTLILYINRYLLH